MAERTPHDYEITAGISVMLGLIEKGLPALFGYFTDARAGSNRVDHPNASSMPDAAADKAETEKSAADKVAADLTTERDTLKTERDAIKTERDALKTEVDRLEKLTGKAAKPPAAGGGGNKKLTADEWLAEELKKGK